MKYNNDQLIDAVASNTSYRQVLNTLGIAEKGGNYANLKRKIAHLNLDTSHFTGQGHNKGKTFIKTSTELYLSNSRPIGSFRLKNRLISEGLLIPVCSNCQLTTWLNQPIPLELDHIDGDSLNNNLNNLRLLCPNCHSFTETYRGKNQQRAKKS